MSEEDISGKVVKKVHELCKIIAKEPSGLHKISQIVTTIAHILADMNIDDSLMEEILELVKDVKPKFDKALEDLEKRRMLKNKSYVS